MVARGKGIFGASIRDYMRLGFGTALGSLLAMLIFIAIGMTLFIIGYVMFAKEKKKEGKDQSQARKIGGLILMGVGCLVGLGLGFPVLLESIGDSI